MLLIQLLRFSIVQHCPWCSVKGFHDEKMSMCEKLQQVESPGAGDDLNAALHAEFAAEVVDVPLDRAHTHDEAAGDFAVGSAFQQQAQHLALALSQSVQHQAGVRRGEW